MPLLRNSQTGALELVADSQVTAALETGTHAIDPAHPVRVEALGGRGSASSPEQIAALQAAGGTEPPAIVSDRAAAEEERAAYEAERFGGAGETLAAGITGAIDMATLGGFSAIERATDEDDTLARSVRQHPTAHAVGQVAGAIATGGRGMPIPTPAGAVSGAARALGTAGEGVGALGRAAIRGGAMGAEGAVLGAGVGVAQAAIQDQPVTLERVVGSIKTNAIIGGLTGGALGAGTSLVGSGIRGAKQLADKVIKPRAAMPDDLAAMDLPALRQAREQHIAALEAEAVPQRAALADDLKAYRTDGKTAKPWIAVEGFKGPKKPRGKKARAAAAAAAADQSAAAPAPAAAADDLRPAFTQLDPAELDDFQKTLVGARKLSDDEIDLIENEFHGGMRFDEINSWLRGKKAYNRDLKVNSLEMDQESKDIVASLEGVFARPESALPRNLVVYRGVRRGAEMPAPGETFADGGFMYASLEKKYATEFAKNEGFFMEIEVPAGTPAIAFRGHQRAIVLPRGLEMRAISVDPETRVVRARVGEAVPDRIEAVVPPADEFDDPFRFLPIGRKSSEEAFAPISSKATPDQRQAVDIYSTTDFQQINGYLRGKTAGTPLQKEQGWYSPDKLLDETSHRGPMPLRTAIRHIDELMETSRAPDDLMVFRGTSGAHLPKWKVGDVYDDPAYPSVTFESKVAEQFHHGKGEGGVGKTFMEIEVPKGTPMVHVSQIAGGAEAEAILPRGTRFRVQNVKNDGNVTVVRVRAEPPSAARRPPEAPAAPVAASAPEMPPIPPELSREFREIAKLTLEADRALDRLLRNPKRLAARPWLAEGPLQQAEHALERLKTVEPELRARMALDANSSGSREAALDTVDDFIERNRTLQARLQLLTPESQGGKWKPASPRLEAIAAAEDSLRHAPRSSLAQEAATGLAMGAMMGVVPGGPLAAAGAYVAPRIARKLTDLVFGRMRRAAAAGEARSSRVVDAIMSTGKMGRPAALPTALSILGGREQRKKPGRPKKDEGAPKERNPLVSAYLRRAEEIRSMVGVAPDGTMQVTPQARAQIADGLSGVAVLDPYLADRLETELAKRIAFLADKLPRRPDIGMQIGPDTVRPSTLEIRSYARFEAAANDPDGVEERVADGTISPEDAEAYRTLYPERLAALTQQIMQRLPELRRTLPERRKLALSILTGLPVHPALEPRILAVLQAQHQTEEGTEGGTMAPPPPQNMGSIKAEPGTPHQNRLQRMG